MAADFLSMLAGQSSPFLGMSPDQTAQLDAVKKQAAMQAILPSLFALGLGYLSRPRGRWYGGQAGALLQGVRDAGQAYQQSYQGDLNQQLSAAKLAQQNQRQNVLDAASISNAQSNQQRTNLLARGLRDRETQDTPLGGDPFAAQRNDPRYKNVVFPPVDVAGDYTQKSVEDFWKGVPRQQNANQNITIRQELADQGQQRVDQGNTRLDQGQQKIDQGNARNDLANAKWKAKLWGLSPVGSTSDPIIARFTKLRSTLPPNIASTMPTDTDIAAMPRNQAEGIYKLYVGDAGKQLARHVENQQLVNRGMVLRQYKIDNPGDVSGPNGGPDPAKLSAYAASLGYDKYWNHVGAPEEAASPSAAPSPAPATPAGTPAPAPTATPATTPAASPTPAAGALPAGALAPTKMPDGLYHKDGQVYEVKGGFVYPHS